jgi:hypothetical protein
MLNFCRRLFPHAASIEAPLYEVLSGPRVKGFILFPGLRHSVRLSTSVNNASQAALLVNPDLNAPLALVTDVSTSAMGAVQQRVQDVWQPIAFSRKLSPAQEKYSGCDRELLAI